MASRSGLEARYSNRFAKIENSSSNVIKAIDSIGNVADQLKTARAIVSTQETNIKALGSTAEEMICGLNTFQDMSGVSLVKNIPVPSADVKASYGKTLGYVQLTMRFLQSGMLHFMEETINAKIRIADLEKIVSQVADYEGEVTMIGELQSLDIDQLERVKTLTSTKIDHDETSESEDEPTPVVQTVPKIQPKTPLAPKTNMLPKSPVTKKSK
jgi:hypothetical protein